jgi:hypothetical protein
VRSQAERGNEEPNPAFFFVSFVSFVVILDLPGLYVTFSKFLNRFRVRLRCPE